MFYTVFQIVIDERNTLEIPATDLTFLCPERQWVMKNAEDGILKEKNIYVYQVTFCVTSVSVKGLVRQHYASRYS